MRMLIKYFTVKKNILLRGKFINYLQQSFSLIKILLNIFFKRFAKDFKAIF